jgi:mono/diheme cytochrome c family protein
MTRLVIAFLFAAGLYATAPRAMDSAGGREIFETHGCVQCHRLNGVGGTAGPDLGRIIDRGFTPAMLAATMWNHAPQMWAAMRARSIDRQTLTEQQAADLFAAFYAAHYFDAPADAARGKAVFAADSCARCHGLEQSAVPAATPVNKWSALTDSVALVASMWNHAATMQAELAKQGIEWPALNGRNIGDLLVYLRNLPGMPHVTPELRITAGEEGQQLFQSKGCATCHAIDALETDGMTLDDVAASMWGHANRLKSARPTINRSEMSALLGYVWEWQFFKGSGNVARGAKVFRARHCTQCHGVAGSGAPDLKAHAGSYDGITIVSALWRHGPAMLEQMNQKGIRWPEFRLGEMADLMAWLNVGTSK